jgi:hypothetical protein
MDHKKIWYFISMKDVKAHIPKFCIFGTYIEFSSNFDAVSFFKLIAMRASSGLISSISYGFRDKLNRKGPTKTKFQNFNFRIFHPI